MRWRGLSGNDSPNASHRAHGGPVRHSISCHGCGGVLELPSHWWYIAAMEEQNMVQIDQGRGRGNPNWHKGTSANPRGRESYAARRARRERIVAEWAAPFGGVGVLKPAEVVLLDQAAELSLRRPRTAEDCVRIANSISKLMAQCGLAHRNHVEPRVPISEPAPVPTGESATDAVTRAMAEFRDGN
jgi:hypothetical protein